MNFPYCAAFLLLFLGTTFCDVSIKTNSPAVIKELHKDLVLECKPEGDQGLTWNAEWRRFDPRSGGFQKIISDEEKYLVNENNCTLTIHNAGKDDLGKYTCSMCNNSMNFTEEIMVESAPFIEPFPSSKNLVQGDALVLECKVWGTPELTISWFKRGEPLDTDDENVKLRDYQEIKNGTLRIEDIDFPDDDEHDEYTCQATNDHGTSNSTILVRVKDKLAALWPFLGICAEVTILCIIIFVYEKRRAKKMEEEERREEADHLTNSHGPKGGKDDIRHRK